jgi:hypothetical protein
MGLHFQVFYLVFKSGNKLKNTEIRGSLFGIVFVSVGILIFLLDKHYFNILFLSACLLVFFVGAILLAFGKVSKGSLFQSFLIFMIPIPDSILKFFITAH